MWQTAIADADLLRALHAAGFRGDRLRAVRIVTRDASGRVARLGLDGLTPPEISGQDLRVAVGRTLGWQHIRSTAFDLTRESRGYRLNGRGSGHGVGLCVIGSAHLAAEGESAEQILNEYFPGLQIAAAPSMAAAARLIARNGPPAHTNILLSLPDEDEGNGAALAEMIERSRDDLARTLGVEPPSKIVLRVHATTDSFERATGRSWFTTGAFLDGELHLLPLAALRERGVLERTIRRELVHAIVDGELAHRPRWVREGAALYFADPRDGATDGRMECPEDRDLASPVSMGSLAAAYARARACFARQIAAGRSWRDVK